MITFCAECKHVYRVNERDMPRYFLCSRHKRSEEQMGYIIRGVWNDAPPYLYCRDVNQGCCPLYEEAPVNQLNEPKGATDENV